MYHSNQKLKADLSHISVLVADDEALARKRVISFLSEVKIDVSILESSNGKETIELIRSKSPDLVFLDIKMTDMTGFDVLSQIPKEQIPIVIFVTAFDNFAVQAFEVRAIDFLLKPYKKDRFVKAFQRGLHQLELDQITSFQNKMEGLMDFIGNSSNPLIQREEHYLDKVVLKSRKKFFFIEVRDILYIKASGYYAEIYTVDKKKHVYRTSMTDFMKKLDPVQFSRLNRSSIINTNFIKEVVSEGLGEYSVVMNDQKSFSISKNYKREFLQKTGIK